MSLNWREDGNGGLDGPEPEDDLTGAAFLLMVAGVGGLMVAVGVWYLIGRWWPCGM
jgi:hypothetical protein